MLLVAEQFVARINARDVDGLFALMADEHRFVDATGAVHEGRERMRAGWNEFFESFPEYSIEVEETVERGECVAIFGWARGVSRAGRSWRMPAAWKAIARAGRVVEWRVYCDVEPMLRSAGIARF
jgi:ketosteroid isomerase-like protein